jgi:hypothetical protein
MKIYLWAISCLHITFANNNYHFENEKYIFDLNIEELMQVRISLEAKTEETILKIPSTNLLLNV